MGTLTLVGTIHRDPNGFPRLMETLERESPDIVTLEMSEYGVAFRERNWPRLKGRLHDVVRNLHEESNREERETHNGPRNPFNNGAIRGILFTLEMPFEFRAVRAYCDRKRIPFHCIDVSSHSRVKLKALEEGVITGDNVRKILMDPPMDPWEEMLKQRALARRLTSGGADTFLVQAFLNGRTEDGMDQRDRYMSLRIREIVRDHGKTLHVGGWEHLLDAPGRTTLYGLLKGLRPKRILAL